MILNQQAYGNASRAERPTSAKIAAQFPDILVQHADNLGTRDHHGIALLAHKAPGSAPPQASFAAPARYGTTPLPLHKTSPTEAAASTGLRHARLLP